MPREPIDTYYLKMLELVASRSTCPRRKVAAIITDGSGHILSTGYNGVPSGYPHCIDKPCPGAGDLPGDSARCAAVHAEQNALLQCTALVRACNIYCTTMPCFTCAKMIANTTIRRIIYVNEYPDRKGIILLEELGREVLSDWEATHGG